MSSSGRRSSKQGAGLLDSSHRLCSTALHRPASAGDRRGLRPCLSRRQEGARALPQLGLCGELRLRGTGGWGEEVRMENA
ncbi:hypothetical protein U9M48_000937 [Paspalum notatum var. saurae]|uniref:Uncharacterized protein n=1 Tax=Paspalum notatum var. saurae TaxID=547442 RepID=A0AAQ3PHH0_PASNO